MFVINSDSNSKITKLVAIVFALSAVVGLVVQLLSILALTRTKLGKLVRHNVIGTMYDVVDESIDEAASRMPVWTKKIESQMDSIDQ